MTEVLAVGFVPGPGFPGDPDSVDPQALAEALLAEGVAGRASPVGASPGRIDLLLEVEDVTLAEASVILELSARLRTGPSEIVPFLFFAAGERAIGAVPERSASGSIQFALEEVPLPASNVVEFRRPENAA